MKENKIKVIDCIIIGAGPSGLSTSYHLKKKKLNCLILEKNNVANSWANMVDSLHLVSPWWTNALPGTFINPFISYKKHSGKYFHKYMTEYAANNKLNILENSKVSQIKSENGCFNIQVNNGEFIYKSYCLVVATGYYSTPYIPKITEVNDFSIPEIHASNFLNHEQLKKKFPKVKKILIVGKRVTAGQLLVELYNLGYEVSLSIRNEIIIKNNDTFFGKIKEHIYFIWEYVRIKFQPNLKSESFPEMDGGEVRTLINENKVRIFNLFNKIEKGKLFFKNDDIKIDLIIYATGYKPTLSFVENSSQNLIKPELSDLNGFESKETKGMFFIGFDNIRNFRSRYLRGIVQDSKCLAKEVFNFLKNRRDEK